MAKKWNWAGKAKIERERVKSKAGFQKTKSGRLTNTAAIRFRYQCECGEWFWGLGPGKCGKC